MSDADAVDLVDTIKRRFEFETWPNRSPDERSLFVWNLQFRGDELNGMRRHRWRRTEPATLLGVSTAPRPEGVAQRAFEQRGPQYAPRVHVHSIWRDLTRTDTMIGTEVFECSSREDAREKVVWLLGEFQSPLIERSHGVGDVAFGTPQDGVLLFARGNLVYLLRNVGSRRVSVRNAGLALDAHATSTPSHRRESAPQQALARGGAEREIVEVALYDAEGDDRPESACRKFVVPEGEVHVSGRTIVYQGPRAGLNALAAYECSNVD